MNYQTRLILGAFKEYILSLDRTDALLVLILILCMGFGRAGDYPVGLSATTPRPSACGVSAAIPHAAPSQTETPSQ